MFFAFVALLAGVVVAIAIPTSTRPTCPPRVICEPPSHLNIIKFLVLTAIVAVFLLPVAIALSWDRGSRMSGNQWHPPRLPPS